MSTSCGFLEHLPEGQRPRCVRSWLVPTRQRSRRRSACLQDLARRLEDRYPSAAASVREGLEETLTILTLGLSDRLRQSLATTNAIESLISRTRHVKRNVKRWRGGHMVLRWTAAAILEAVKGFRRIEGSQRHAEARRRSSRSRSAAWHRRVSGARRVECHPSRR